MKTTNLLIFLSHSKICIIRFSKWPPDAALAYFKSKISLLFQIKLLETIIQNKSSQIKQTSTAKSYSYWCQGCDIHTKQNRSSIISNVLWPNIYCLCVDVPMYHFPKQLTQKEKSLHSVCQKSTSRAFHIYRLFLSGQLKNV